MAIYNTTDFVTAVNNATVNELGGEEGVVLAEDLSNIVDFGLAVDSLSEDSLKHWRGNLAIGVYNMVISRVINEKTFDFYRSSHEFGGALQRLMVSGLLDAKESHVRNLDSSHGSYFDGKYYGVPIDGKIYLSEDAKKVVNSIPDVYFKSMFTNVADFNKYMTLITTNVENSITNQMNVLAKRLLMAIVVDTLEDGRKVDLVTEFNASQGIAPTIPNPDYDEDDPTSPETIPNPNFMDYATILKDRKTFAYFKDFANMTIERVCDYMSDPNTKYNDGTVTTWTPKEYVRAVVISEFDKAIKYVGNPINFHNEDGIKAESIGAWQTTSNVLLPTLETTATITIAEGTEEEPTTYNNVVALVYDKDCAGIENILKETGVERVGAELFTNYHHHTVNRYYVDSRLGAVAFTLN